MYTPDGPSVPLPSDPEKLRALGAKLAQDFEQYERDRKNAEIKWMKNLRQYLGKYDPEIEKDLPAGRSRAYPRLTRVKCVSMLSRLMNLLFPTSEKNWGVKASPVPNLSEEDLVFVLNEVMQGVQETGDGQPPTSEEIEQAIRDFATKRAANLERELDDQLGEIGGDKNLDWVALSRKVLMSGIIYGAGVVKGPFVRMQKQRTWEIDPNTGQATPINTDAMRPQFEFVPIWDYYPDMSAKAFHQMDGQFQRLVLSRQQVRQLADRPDFMRDAVLNYLTQNPKGNYKERTFESELKGLGVHTNVNRNDGRKYEALIWDGYIPSADLKAIGVPVPDDPAEMYDACIWMIDQKIIKANISPWVELEPENRINMYHHFVFEEDDSNLLGNGLPNIMRDSQMGMAAAVRMLLDNASVTCGPNLEVNRELLALGQDTTAIAPYKIWYREGLGAEAAIPAVKKIDIDSHIPDLQNLISMFREFADVETFVNAATGGDMQKMPSEPFRTAAGASMLRGDAALPFRDVVRNYDVFTTSIISSLLAFNKHFNAKPSISGDFQPVARGSSSLIAKEVRGMAYDQLAQTLTPKAQMYINWRGLCRERLAVRDVDINAVMVNDDEADRREAAESMQAQKQAQEMESLMRAEVRKLLTEAVKNLTQSDKNAAAADAAVYNAVLGGLERGVAPTDVDLARAGGPVPDGVVQQQGNGSGKGANGSSGNSSGGSKKSSANSKSTGSRPTSR